MRKLFTKFRENQTKTTRVMRITNLKNLKKLLNEFDMFLPEKDYKYSEMVYKIKKKVDEEMEELSTSKT